MAMERVPYLVGGGFEHSAEVMRAMLAAATSGAEGIVTPGDFKVRPLSVPGTSVRVAPGNALIRNSYGGGQAQSYACRAGSETEVPIEATGSAGSRTDLIVARIDDPTYQGGSFDPLTFEAARFEVIRGVPASTKTVAGLGLTYPAIPLARVTLPKSTGTVTSSMITDLRFLAQPRKERHLFVHPLSRADEVQYLSDSRDIGDWWPSPLVTGWTVDVPSWAQRVRIVGQVGGVLLRGGEVGDAEARGRFWARIGSQYDGTGIDAEPVEWNLDTSQISHTREAWLTGADRSVPAALRGQEGVMVGVRGRVDYRRGSTPLPELNYLSVVTLDLEFYETAV